MVRVDIQHLELLTGRLYRTLDRENRLARGRLTIDQADLVKGKSALEKTDDVAAASAQFVQSDTLTLVTGPRSMLSQGSG